MVTKIEDLSNAELATVFNAATGQTVSKFTNKAAGVRRVRAALESTNSELNDVLSLAGLDHLVEPAPTLVVEPKAGRGRNRALPKSSERTKAKRVGTASEQSAARQSTHRRGGRLDEVLAMLRRESGATCAEIAQAMSWLPHTTRAYLSKGGAAGRAATIMTEKVERAGKKTTVYSVGE